MSNWDHIPQSLLGVQNFFPPAVLKTQHAFKKESNWDRIPQPLLDPQMCFRLRRADRTTRFNKMDIKLVLDTRLKAQHYQKIDIKLGPHTAAPQNFFRLRWAERITRLRVCVMYA